MTLDTGINTGLTAYGTLAAKIRDAIREGVYRPGQLIGSEHGLAREESISRMTVRRASELLINEGLLERRPGKGLYVSSRGAGTRSVQVIAGNLKWEPSVQVARGVQSLARELGVEVHLYDAQGDMELDLERLRRLPESGGDGAVIVSLHNCEFNEVVYQLKASGFPFVLVDQRLREINVPSVLADNYSGGFQVGQELLRLGHRRIAFIGDLVAATVQDRLNGLRDAMADAGLPLPRSHVTDLLTVVDRMGDWSEQIDASVRRLMAEAVPPTAIFCSCDGVARPAYRTLAAMGLRVPQDVSVVGFDDDPIAEWLSPPLTSVRQPFHEMGRVAIEVLSRQMDDPNLPAEHLVMPVELIRRGSTAAAPRTPVSLLRTGNAAGGLICRANDTASADSRSLSSWS